MWLEQAISLGATKENEPTCELLIGRVVQYHIMDDIYSNGRIDAKQLQPVNRLAERKYAKLGEEFEIVRAN